MKKRWFTLCLLIIAFISPPFLAKADEDSQSDDQDVINLDEIVVSATRLPNTLDSISASSSVIPEKQIRQSTATDLGELLVATNIVQVADYGPGSISIASMRGSSFSQVLVLVDGERVNDSLNGGADLDKIPIANVERIEIIRGGQSAMYGADAVGGIINIITKQPSETTAKVWSNLGSYDSLEWGVEASRRAKKVSGLLSFSQADYEGDFTFEDKYGDVLTRENADVAKRNLFGNLIWDMSDSMVIKLSADHLYSDKGDPGPIGQYSPEAVKQEKSNGLKADLEYSLNNRSLYKLSVYKRDNVLQYTNPQPPYPTDDTHKSDAKGAEFQLYLQHKLSVPLICGVLFRDEDIDSTAFGDRERLTYSAYAQQEIGIDTDSNPLFVSRIAIFPALRWDHYSDFESDISPKFGVLASFGAGRYVTLKANLGRSYRAPTMNDLYWKTDAFATGNPDLKPESSIDADAGVYVNLVEPSCLPSVSAMRCAVSYFHNLITDGIQWTPGKGGKWSPANISEIKSRGVETEMSLNLALLEIPDLLRLSGVYTFVRAEDSLKRQLIYRPKQSFGYTFRAGTDGIWGQIQGLYRGRSYYTVQNTKWLEPFFKHDIQFGIERKLHRVLKLGVIFEIKNVFDTKYQLVSDYPLPGREWGIKTIISAKGE